LLHPNSKKTPGLPVNKEIQGFLFFLSTSRPGLKPEQKVNIAGAGLQSCDKPSLAFFDSPVLAKKY
jgi:hypothetical protein